MHRGSNAIVVALVAAILGLVILVWGSSQGEQIFSPPEGSWGPPRATEGWLPTMPDVVPEPMADDREPVEEATDPTNWLLNLAFALFGMAVVGALLLLYRWFSQQRLEEKERREIAEEDELVALLDATSEDVRYQALSEGDPRNGVVACWVALEEAVQRSGLERDKSETAAELTTRVLNRWQVDPTSITALSEAYREARFSRHPVSEEQRVAAVDALERIHVDLRRRVKAEQEARDAAERAAAEKEATEQAAKAERETSEREGAGRKGRR